MLGRTLVLAASASMAAASFGRLGQLDTFDVPSSLADPRATVFPFTPSSVDLVGTGNWVLNPHIDSTHQFAFQTSKVQVHANFQRSSCAAGGRPVKSVCTDSPGYVGLSYDRCTGRFITVTDNGPTQACSNDAEATGFALGDYTPVLGQFYIDRNEARMSPFTPLKAANGSYLTGLPNKATDGKIFEGLKANGECQNFGLNTYRPSGLDLADVQFLNEGLFIGSDEYGPKLVVFNTDGTVLMSYVPKGLETTIYKEDVNGGPTNGVLPAIFAGRTKNRGISALAVDPKKERLVACLESAADGAGVEGATASADLRTSRVVRCVQLNITDVLAPVVINEFVVLQSDAAVEYTAAKRGHASVQSQVSFVGGTWSEDRCTILLLEQGRVDSQLPSLVGVAVDVCGGANDTLHADYTGVTLNSDKTPTGLAALEGKTTQGDAETNLRLLPQKVFATKQWKAFDLRDAFTANPGKISGVTLISPYAIAVIEDTDFGYRASATAFEPKYAKVSVVHFPREVWRTQGREVATADWCESSVGPKAAIFLQAATKNSVTTYEMPPMVLSGAVNPAGDWWGAPQTGTNNNRQCSAVAFSSTTQKDEVCSDAPAFTGLTYDRCKNTFRALTDAGPTQSCSSSVQAHTYQDFSPSFVQFDLHAAQLGANSWKVVRPAKFTSLRVFYDLFVEIARIGGTATGNRVQSGSEYRVGGVSPVAPFSKKGKVGGACGADITKSYASFAQGNTANGAYARDVSPTGMHKVREGLYATCDGYSSSVVFFDESGRIVRRYTVRSPLVASSAYAEPTHQVFPRIFAGTRHLGKCVLAVKADGSRLAVLFDQPLTGARLSSENAQVAQRSNVVRAAMVNIRDLAHPYLESEKVVEQSNAEVAYTAAVTGYVNTQQDVRFTAATWLNGKSVLVLETARSNHTDGKIAARLFSVDFGTGTDIKDVDAFNNAIGTNDGTAGVAIVEYQGRFPNTTADHLARLTPEVKAMTKTQVLDFQDVAVGAANTTNAQDGVTTSRLAGIAMASPFLLAVFEPSTYGYGQEAREKVYSKVHLIHLAQALEVEDTDDCYPHAATNAPTGGASSAVASLTVLLIALVALML